MLVGAAAESPQLKLSKLEADTHTGVTGSWEPVSGVRIRSSIRPAQTVSKSSQCSDH